MNANRGVASSMSALILCGFVGLAAGCAPAGTLEQNSGVNAKSPPPSASDAATDAKHAEAHARVTPDVASFPPYANPQAPAGNGSNSIAPKLYPECYSFGVEGVNSDCLPDATLA
jgi:hypothetical protein